MRDTKGEGIIGTKIKRNPHLSSHKDYYHDYQENTNQIFLCLQTNFRECYHLVMFFLLYQKRSNKKFA